MHVFKHIAGYLSLVVSAAAFLGARFVLTTFIDTSIGVVAPMTYGIVFCTLAILTGSLGAYLLIPERYLAVIASVVFALLALTSLLGSILELTDYLSATGYLGFGSTIMIMYGNSVLPVGAAMVAATAVVCAIRTVRSGTRLTQPRR